MPVAFKICCLMCIVLGAAVGIVFGTGFLTSTWLLAPVAFITGLTAGVWLDHLLEN